MLLLDVRFWGAMILLSGTIEGTAFLQLSEVGLHQSSFKELFIAANSASLACKAARQVELSLRVKEMHLLLEMNIVERAEPHIELLKCGTKPLTPSWLLLCLGQKGEGCEGGLVIHTSGQMNGGPTDLNFHERLAGSGVPVKGASAYPRVIITTCTSHLGAVERVTRLLSHSTTFVHVIYNLTERSSEGQSTIHPAGRMALLAKDRQAKTSWARSVDLQMNAGLGHLDWREPHVGRPARAFGGTGELHLLLDRCVGQRARGTCCPPFLFRFENRVNGEWAEGKKKGKAEVVLQMAKRGGSTGKEWEIFKDDFFVLLAKRRAK
ncbi:hypothetical protein V6N11_034316 [Hibiscus sabdariffa]|uniref:Uncharacterized protein n=1 Tax=Hibiscus sabdariffa TaxID=183260 RepID=A0ABR1ZYJ7_9ROSI